MRRSVSVAVLITVVVLGFAVWGARNSGVAAQGKAQNAEVKIALTNDSVQIMAVLYGKRAPPARLLETGRLD